MLLRKMRPSFFACLGKNYFFFFFSPDPFICHAVLHFVQVNFFRVVVKIDSNHLSLHSSWYNKQVNAKVSKIILEVNYYC